jgi:ABC-2 type transport system permease protein
MPASGQLFEMTTVVSVGYPVSLTQAYVRCDASLELTKAALTGSGLPLGVGGPELLYQLAARCGLAIHTTLAAVPDRRAVITAKVTVVTAITLVLGVIVSTTSFLTTNAMLASRHVGLSINDPGCLRAVLAYGLIVPVCALIGTAFGAVLRHATASIVAVVGLLFIVPMLFGGDRYKLLKEIGDYLPLPAESRLALNPSSYTSLGQYPGTITGSWIALAAWALVSVIVAVVVVRRRDV